MADVLRRRFGTAVSGFPDGRALIATGNSSIGPLGNAVANVGSVLLYGPGGEALGEWPNPDGATDSGGQPAFFGYTLVALPGNRFAASSLRDRGKVFIFSAAQPGPPLTIITNPSPSSGGNFGKSIAGLGPDRLLIGDHFDTGAPGRVGSVRIYDYAGNLLRTIRNPVDQDFDEFGRTLAVVDDHRFLVGAPYAKVVYFPAGPATNDLAGAVYLYDDTGGLLRTFTGPNPDRSMEFGAAIAMLDAGRAIIGSPSDRQGGLSAGRAFLYNLGGVLLGTAENPAPNHFDQFGAAIAVLDGRRFVIGAPSDDTGRNNAGSIYGYDVPLPVVELGSVIPEPPQPLDRMGTFAMFGPPVNPPDAAFWHVPSQKLFAVKPGGVLVSWKLAGTAGTNNWEATVVWPTSSVQFQTHIAGPTPIDVSDTGAYSNVVLHATTSGASLISSNSQRLFTAGSPGESFLMLSAGHPTNGPIRFQFVRSLAWNTAGFLHDAAPAIIGSPIVSELPHYRSLARNPLGLGLCAVFGTATFVAVAWLRLPLTGVLAVVGGLACVACWRRLAP